MKKLLIALLAFASVQIVSAEKLNFDEASRIVIQNGGRAIAFRFLNACAQSEFRREINCGNFHSANLKFLRAFAGWVTARKIHLVNFAGVPGLGLERLFSG